MLVGPFGLDLLSSAAVALLLLLGYAVLALSTAVRAYSHANLPVELLLEPLLIAMIGSFLNQILGPPFFKWAINHVGEAHTRARTPGFDGVRDVVILAAKGRHWPWRASSRPAAGR